MYGFSTPNIIFVPEKR